MYEKIAADTMMDPWMSKRQFFVSRGWKTKNDGLDAPYVKVLLALQRMITSLNRYE